MLILFKIFFPNLKQNATLRLVLIWFNNVKTMGKYKKKIENIVNIAVQYIS